MIPPGEKVGAGEPRSEIVRQSTADGVAGVHISKEHIYMSDVTTYMRLD